MTRIIILSLGIIAATVTIADARVGRPKGALVGNGPALTGVAGPVLVID